MRRFLPLAGVILVIVPAIRHHLAEIAAASGVVKGLINSPRMAMRGLLINF